MLHALVVLWWLLASITWCLLLPIIVVLAVSIWVLTGHSPYAWLIYPIEKFAESAGL
jgi:hypothetical protein